MKAKILHWQHQGHDGPNTNGNATISEIPDVDTMSSHRRRMKEETVRRDKKINNNRNINNQTIRKGDTRFDGNCHG